MIDEWKENSPGSGGRMAQEMRAADAAGTLSSGKQTMAPPGKLRIEGSFRENQRKLMINRELTRPIIDRE
jgi:hypothetical protein